MDIHHEPIQQLLITMAIITGLYTEILPRGGKFGVWKKEGGRKLTIVLCEAQGGCYTLHLLCWHASITLA